MSQNYSLISILRTLKKWRLHIFIVTLISAIFSVIISVFVLKSYYQSFALVYPLNQSMGDRSALFGTDAVDADSYFYGSKHDVNRIITVATASTLVQYVINEYKLTEHYNLKGKKYEATSTTEKFMKNYQVYKTDKGAIRINLIDTDKELAATIVKDIVETIDNEISKPIIKSKIEKASLFKSKATNKKVELDSLQKSFLSTSVSNASYHFQKLNYENALAEYIKLSDLAEQYDIAAKTKVSGIQIVENAYPAEKKIKPVRWKICVASTFLAFFIACLGALSMEQWNKIKVQL